MNTLKKIFIKDIPVLLEDEAFWSNSFLSISKHRLYAHYKNPCANPEDIVLLLAYVGDDLVGYMGVFMDVVHLDLIPTKIGWLSTWWVHPKTKGSGIGREILNSMYESLEGKIGISQFTPSAKRVYDKSGLFFTLKESKGVKAVLRSNLTFVVPALFPKAKWAMSLFEVLDSGLNLLLTPKFYFHKKAIKQQLKNISVAYLDYVDMETMRIVRAHNQNHISSKDASFFQWMKSYQWVQEAPLLGLTQKKDYEFSMYDRHFNHYLIQVRRNKKVIGFLVLQRRNYVCKVLFAYYDSADASVIANIIKLQSIEQNLREIICYDSLLVDELSTSSVFLYKTKKIKQSIISKAFGKSNFDDVVVNFGDGDCSFA